MSYADFLASKRRTFSGVGRAIDQSLIPDGAFGFQRDLTSWAARKGRAAIFADTGMGKTLMQLAWAHGLGERTLILSPLAVARQTVGEGQRWGIPVTYARDQSEAAPTGITITNYEMMTHFAMAGFDAVVLDESSILKNFEGKVRAALIERCANVPLRLCCTATPAPNDIAEIANHAEFLGILSRTEMLATFFVHDDNGWRLKRHASEAFYRWLASWGMSVKRPSDLGYRDDGWELPELAIRPVIVQAEIPPNGQLFHVGLKGIQDRSRVRRLTATARVAATADLVRDQPAEQWLIWCGLNDEQDQIAAQLGSDCVSVAGSLDPDEKLDREERWRTGNVRTLVTKPSIFGFGMNWQHCARMAFLGLSDSYEQYYQAIRRCWRFGQARPVEAHIVLSEPEAPIFENVLRKEREAERMGRELVAHVREFERAEISEARAREPYDPQRPMALPEWIGAA